MSTRTKSIVILACTLMCGILIGALGTSTWQHRRNVVVVETRRPGGLMRQIERIIEIQDETQRQEVKIILSRAEQSFMLQRKRMIDSLTVHRQLLLRDLEQILEPDQWQQLEAWLNRKRKLHHPNWKDQRSERREQARKSSAHRPPNKPD